MYWLDHWEQRLDVDACREAVERVNRIIVETLPTPDDPLEYLDAHQSSHRAESRAPRLAVVGITRHRLRFYVDAAIWLYRLACRNPAFENESTERAYLFVVARAREGAGDLEDITILDWTSPPIHRLNEKLGLDLSRFDDEVVAEYLLFFTSFIAGEESEGDPDRVRLFALAKDSTDLGWRSDLPERIEAVARRERLQMFALPIEGDKPDEPDFPRRTDTPTRLSIPDVIAHAVRSAPITMVQQQAAVSAAFRQLKRNPEIVVTEAAPPAETPAEDLRLRFDGLVLYGTALFRSRFSVFSRGMVVMDEDTPIAGAEDLPVQSWEVAKLRFGLRILRHVPARQLWTNEDVRAALRPPAGAASSGASRSAPPTTDETVFRRRRIKGDLTCPSMNHPQRIVFDDVEFIGQVVFDDCVFEHSLEFRRCRFMQSLSFKNTTIKGSFVLSDCRIDGAVAEGSEENWANAQPEPALRLDGLIVERGVRADRLTVVGQVRGESMRITGGFQARGLRAWRRGFLAVAPGKAQRPRLDRRAVETTQLNISRSNIQGLLDLSSIVDSGFRPGVSVRTHLGGEAVLTGVIADAVALTGATFHGDVNLDWIECRGTVDLSLTAPLRWRSQTIGALTFNRAKVNFLHLNGCYVGGALTMIELVVSWSIFAEMRSGFRCRVEGELILSGASIGGGIEIEGIWVAGELLMVTGKCARIRAGCGIWAKEGKAQFVSADVGGFVLDSVGVTAGVSLVGVRVRNAGGYAKGGIRMRGLRLGGPFSLWMEESPDLLRAQASSEGLGVDGETLASLRAVIDGDVDLRGIRAGDVDFSGAQIGGGLYLDNADISGRITAVNHGPARLGSSGSGPSFDARNGRVAGDVDLWTLSATGDIVANGLESRGAIRFLETARSDRPPVAAECAGRIHLEGVVASTLVITGANITNAEILRDRDKAMFLLAGARLGQLEIQGFVSAPTKRHTHRLALPVTCDLSRVAVGDWKLGRWTRDPQHEVRALLASAVPFDRNVYVTLEERLAKLDYRKAANQTWRAMVRRGSSRLWYPVYLFNSILSGNGTLPGLLIVWLALSMLPVAGVVSDARNITFPAPSVTARPQPERLTDDKPTPDHHADVQNERSKWSILKAWGLTVTYAAPVFFNPQGSSAPSARDEGPVCATSWLLMPLRRHETSRECDNDAVFGLGSWRPTPFTIAFGMSLIQRILWLFVAGNLPAIIRRRK